MEHDEICLLYAYQRLLYAYQQPGIKSKLPVSTW